MTHRLAEIVALTTLVVACGSSADPSTPTISGAITTSDEVATTLVPSSTTAPTEVVRSPEPTESQPTLRVAVSASLSSLSDLVADPLADRLLAVEQRGIIFSLAESEPVEVLNISHLTKQNGEQGLLGAALSLDGSTIYLNFTSTDEGAEGDTVIAAVTRTADGSFDANSLVTIMTISQPYGNHNGGDLEVLSDGSLLIAVGDGGSGGDPQRHAHNLDDPLGKLLRIHPLAGGGYSIPRDNPYVEIALGEVWSSGLRNPWRIDVDPVTADLWIADVGQGEHEEINRVDAANNLIGGKGVDFGWSSSEGVAAFNTDVSPDPRSTEIKPVFTYPHDDGACSITGGVVYRGELIDDLWGWYIYGDYCTGAISGYNYITGTNIKLAEVASPTAIERDHRGEIVIATAGGDVVSVGLP